jgi:serine/threonine protein kinase
MKGIEGLTLGRYELRRRVAQGGTAEVYLAYDHQVRRQVAVKVLYGRDDLFVRRFEREALAVGALSHNHILPLYDFGEQNPWYYLVMPYVDGGTLRDYLIRQKILTLEEAASFLSQIASALQYAHEHGVVHRDVKPSNILLRPDGYAYLVDFGLAKAMQETEALTSAGAMVGTPEYMSPEQSNGASEYRSDIYSLGIILYQMLTGQLPFVAESPVAVSLKHIQSIPPTPRSLNSEIPQNIEEVILKAMAKDANHRYQQAKDFSAALWKALQQEMSTGTVSSHVMSGVEAEGKKVEQTIDATLVSVASAETASRETLWQFPSQFGSAGNSQSKKPARPDTSVLPPTTWLSRRLQTPGIRSVAALLCLVLLLLTLSLGALTWQLQHGHFLDKETLSSLAVKQQVAGTATAISEATLAAQARVEGTSGITSAIGTGKILYANALTTPGGGWIDDGNQCFFSSQGYHVQTFIAHEFAWCYSGSQRFTNIAINVQTVLLRGEVYGLVFRLSPVSQEFYTLEINEQGEYRFVLANGSDPTNWVTLIDWTRSSAIQAGYNRINTFLVLASGSTFRFYVNKQLIVTNYSNASYASGLIGFLVGGDNQGGAEALFENILIIQR